jgi:hypothetical protein
LVTFPEPNLLSDGHAVCDGKVTESAFYD